MIENRHHHYIEQSSFSKDELIDMIKISAASIGMSEWEINMLTNICSKKQCLWKGYNILEEYSKLQIDINKFIQKRSSYRDKLSAALESGRDTPLYVKKMAEYSLKTWISILRLRLLQWSPRPINITTDSVASCVQSNFLFEFNKDVRELLAAIKEKGSPNLIECGVDTLHLVVLLSTAATISPEDATALQDLLLMPPSCSPFPASSDTASQPLYTPEEVQDVVSNNLELLAALKRAIKVEIACENTFNAFSSLNSTRIELLEADKLPILRIQYSDIAPPRFEGDHSGHQYFNACHYLLDFYYSVFTPDVNRVRTSDNDRHLAILSALAAINNKVAPTTVREKDEIRALEAKQQQDGSPTTKRKGCPLTSPGLRGQQPLDLSPPVQERRLNKRPVSSHQSRTSGNRHLPSQEMVDISNRREERVEFFPSEESWVDEQAHRRVEQQNIHTSDPLAALQTTPPIPGTPVKSERFLNVTVGVLGKDDMMMYIERVPMNVHTSRLLIRGFLQGCSNSTKRVCRIGDEIVAVNGISVLGERTKKITEIIRMDKEEQRVAVSSGHVRGKHVVLKLRRYFEGWQEFAKPVATTTAVVSTTIKFSANPPKKIKRSKGFVVSAYENGDGTPTPTVELELRVLKLQQDILAIEKRMRTADEARLEQLKNKFVEKYEEMTACESIIQEISRGHSEEKGNFYASQPLGESLPTGDEPAYEATPDEPYRAGIGLTPEKSYEHFDSMISELTMNKVSALFEPDSQPSVISPAPVATENIPNSQNKQISSNSAVGRANAAAVAALTFAASHEEAADRSGDASMEEIEREALLNVKVAVLSEANGTQTQQVTSNSSVGRANAAAAAVAMSDSLKDSSEKMECTDVDNSPKSDEEDGDSDGDGEYVEKSREEEKEVSTESPSHQGRMEGNTSPQYSEAGRTAAAAAMALALMSQQMAVIPAVNHSCDDEDEAEADIIQETMVDVVTETRRSDTSVGEISSTSHRSESERAASAAAAAMALFISAPQAANPNPKLSDAKEDDSDEESGGFDDPIQDGQVDVVAETRRSDTSVGEISSTSHRTESERAASAAAAAMALLASTTHPVSLPPEQEPNDSDSDADADVVIKEENKQETQINLTASRRQSDKSVGEGSMSHQSESESERAAAAVIAAMSLLASYHGSIAGTHDADDSDDEEVCLATGRVTLSEKESLRRSSVVSCRSFGAQFDFAELGQVNEEPVTLVAEIDAEKSVVPKAEMVDSFTQTRVEIPNTILSPQQRLSMTRAHPEESPCTPLSRTSFTVRSSSPIQQRLSDPLNFQRSPLGSLRHSRVRGDSFDINAVAGRLRGDSMRSITSASRPRGSSYDSSECSTPTDQWFRRLSRAAPESLRYALRGVDKKYASKNVEMRAASKIQVWWRLMHPQKKLSRRMFSRALCNEIVIDLVEITIERCHASHRKRYKMMRQGAAIIIQRYYRHWRHTVLGQVIRIQRAFRRSSARCKLKRVVACARAAILVARFIFNRRRRLGKVVGKKKLYKMVIRNFIEIIGYRLRDEKFRHIKMLSNSRLIQKSRRGTNLKTFRATDNDMYIRRVEASIVIQSVFRMAMARCQFHELVKEKQLKRQISVWLSMVRLRRQFLRRRFQTKCAVKLQKFWRGAYERWKLMLRVLAGIRIVSTWRRYRQYWKLKHCLRRNEIPLSVTFHGLRNIPTKNIETGSIKVRVSVWWSELLHLVTKEEFMTVLQSKRPNIVRTTNLHVGIPQKVAPKVITQAPMLQALGKVGSDRKLSLAQRTRILAPESIDNKKLDPASALAQFAKMHGVKGAHVKMAGSDITHKPPPKASSNNSKARASFRMAVKKSMSLGAMMALKDAVLKEEESASESSESSEKKSHKKEESSSDDEDDYYDEGDLVKAKAKRSSNAPQAVLDRVHNDKLGRDSVHILGHNLLEQGSTDSHMMTSMSGAARNMLNSLAMDAISTMPPRKSLKPVPRKGKEEEVTAPLKPAASLTASNLLTINSPLKALSPKASISAPNVTGYFTVDLDDEELYIPGCHGNTVLRFDIYDGDEIFGTSVFHLATDQSLMFWGGEQSQPVSAIKKQDLRGGRTTSVINMQSATERPMLDFRVVAGPAGRSKCGWASVSFKGTGPIKRRSRTRGFVKSLFDTWEHLYLSMDGEGLHFYTTRNAADPLVYLALKNVKSFYVELADQRGDKKNAAMEDKFIVVLATTYWDVIHIRFPVPVARESWVRTFVQAHEYIKDPLKSIASLKNGASFVGFNRSQDSGDKRVDRARARR